MASLVELFIEQQLHALKYDASAGLWMWYGHLGSFTFQQRRWPVNAIPDDQQSLPWAIQGSFMIQLNEGDRITFYRSARSFPGTILNMSNNNSRVFFLRNMSSNISWHDAGLTNFVDSVPQYPTGIDTNIGTNNPGLWDSQINVPEKFF
ncbi:MAG: hypothetical protein HQ472_10845 [Ignavibacteria bacterium]|nr:hypothetical protein [Ignavibacteria bacterium]